MALYELLGPDPTEALAALMAANPARSDTLAPDVVGYFFEPTGTPRFASTPTS